MPYPVRLTANMFIAASLVLSAFAATAQPRLQKVQSKHYLIHSDLPDELIVDLGTRMDAMYAEYSRRLSDFGIQEDRQPLDVYLFNRKADYLNFTQRKYMNTGGVFIAGKNQLVAYLEGQRDTLRRTLQHEAFHQFAHKAIGPNMPVWLNEGMSQLFEEAIWTGEQFLMGQVPPRRLRQLQDDIKSNRLIPLKTLMGLTPERWSQVLAADASRGSTYYNQSWAMTYYMAYGDEGRNGARLVLLLKALEKNKDPDTAFRDSYGGNLLVFTSAFEKFAMEMKPTPEAALIDRHEVLADLMAELSTRGTRFNTVAEFRKVVEQSKYRLKYTRGNVSWTAEPAGYFRDANGRPFTAEQMLFEPRKMSPLPDLVFRHPAQRIVLRARFFDVGGKLEHEVLVEPARSSVTAQIER